MVIFNFCALSTLLVIFKPLGPIFLYFNLNSFPFSVRATTIKRLVFLLCTTCMVVSGSNVISCSKLR